MPLSAYQQPVQTDPATQFTEALVTNDIGANVSLVLPGRTPYWFIRAFSIVSVQNLAWELWLFTSATNLGGTVATEKFHSVWAFAALSAGPPADPGYAVSAGSPPSELFHYYVDGNMMPYYDADQPGAIPQNARLHVRLINRSGTAKIADDPGALLLTVYAAPQGMQV